MLSSTEHVLEATGPNAPYCSVDEEVHEMAQAPLKTVDLQSSMLSAILFALGFGFGNAVSEAPSNHETTMTSRSGSTKTHPTMHPLRHLTERWRLRSVEWASIHRSVPADPGLHLAGTKTPSSKISTLNRVETNDDCQAQHVQKTHE